MKNNDMCLILKQILGFFQSNKKVSFDQIETLLNNSHTCVSQQCSNNYKKRFIYNCHKFSIEFTSYY